MKININFNLALIINKINKWY